MLAVYLHITHYGQGQAGRHLSGTACHSQQHCSIRAESGACAQLQAAPAVRVHVITQLPAG